MALALPVAGLADGAVWRVSGAESTLFLGGTMHRLPPDQYPLPAEYQAAYEQAELVVFETDIAAMRSPEVQSRLAARSRLPEEQTLASVLEPSTYRELERYCLETGFDIDHLTALRPAPAMLTLLTVVLDELGITAPGVDEHFFRRARADAKEVASLETADQQIDYLITLDQGDPDRFVSRSIADLREARSGNLVEGLGIWRRGREGPLIEHFLRDQMADSPRLYQVLLVDRNRAWMHTLRRYLKTARRELVLVGVAHLVGDDGLLALLAAEGYEVAPLDAR